MTTQHNKGWETTTRFPAYDSITWSAAQSRCWYTPSNCVLNPHMEGGLIREENHTGSCSSPPCFQHGSGWVSVGNRTGWKTSERRAGLMLGGHGLTVFSADFPEPVTWPDLLILSLDRHVLFLGLSWLDPTERLHILYLSLQQSYRSRPQMYMF